jgi:hypothetical protein
MGVPRVEVGGRKNEGDPLRPHLLDHARELARARGDAGKGLERGHQLDSEAVGEVGPELVVFDGARPAMGPHLAEPASEEALLLAGPERGGQTAGVEEAPDLLGAVAVQQLRAHQALDGLPDELLVALLEARALLREPAREVVPQQRRDPHPVHRIREVVRVPVRVQVPHGSVCGCRGDLERRDDARRVEVAGAGREDLRIPCPLEQHRGPPRLEVHAGENEQVRVVQPPDQARPGLDDVGVLGALRDHEDRDDLAPDLAHQGAEVRHRNDDVQLGGSRTDRRQQTERAEQDDQRSGYESLHDDLLVGVRGMRAEEELDPRPHRVVGVVVEAAGVVDVVLQPQA